MALQTEVGSKELYVNQGTIRGWEKNGCGIACMTIVLRHAAEVISRNKGDVHIISPDPEEVEKKW